MDTTFNPNVSVPEDKAFSVGVGSFGSESNGIVVRKNGIVTANAMTQALFDADTSGKIVVTKEILNNELPNTDDFVDKSGDTMTGLLKTPIVQEKTLIQTGGLFGNLNVDWTLFSNFDFTLTENSVITQTGVPESGYNATITIYVKGDFALTLPTEWIVIGGVYDPNGTQFIVQSWDDGNFYCAIGGGEIDLSNYLQKSGGIINGSKDYTGNSPDPSSYDFSVLSNNKGLGFGTSNGIPSIQGFGSGTSYNLSLAPNVGNVGIGTTNPLTKLHAEVSASNTSGTYAGLFWNKSSNNSSQYGVAIRTEQGGGSPLRVSSDGGTTDCFSILNNGNVVLSNIQVFADNTSASSLEVGTIYRTSDGTLKIKY